MPAPSTRALVFNVAAGMVGAVALLAAMRSMLFSPAATPCSERYLNATHFALQRAGVMLTAADLQAGFGGRDAGVIDNVTIAPVDNAPAPVAMAVRLPKGSTSPRAALTAKGGMSFPWQPRSIQTKSSACLAYGLLVPADFDFHLGGVLPGLSGADPDNPQRDNFLAQLAWRPRGQGGVTSRVTSEGNTRAEPAEREGFALTPGRWVKLEQEVVLNAPKQADGILRVWIDGRLAVERTDMVYRLKPEVKISGVAAEVFYGRDDAVAAAPKDATIWVTPFELRWE